MTKSFSFSLLLIYLFASRDGGGSRRGNGCARRASSPCTTWCSWLYCGYWEFKPELSGFADKGLNHGTIYPSPKQSFSLKTYHIIRKETLWRYNLGKESRFLFLTISLRDGRAMILAFLIIIIIFFFCNKISLHNPGWFQTCSPPASASWGLELQACTTTSILATPSAKGDSDPLSTVTCLL